MTAKDKRRPPSNQTSPRPSPRSTDGDWEGGETDPLEPARTLLAYAWQDLQQKMADADAANVALRGSWVVYVQRKTEYEELASQYGIV